MRTGRSWPRVGRACGTAVAVSFVLTGCVLPARDPGAFEANAEGALSSAVSEARTGALVLRARLEGKVTNAYADTVITDGESAIGPIEDSFGNVDPPGPRDDRLRNDVMSLLGDTSDAFATARISVRRGDVGQMRTAATQLTEVADRMEDARDGLG